VAVSSVNRLRRPTSSITTRRSRSADAQTATGSTVNLRPIRSSDGPRLCRFHESLSAHSVNLRYSFMHPRLSPAEVELFTHVDNVDRLDLIGEDQGRIIAVGRYERIPGPPRRKWRSSWPTRSSIRNQVGAVGAHGRGCMAKRHRRRFRSNAD